MWFEYFLRDPDGQLLRRFSQTQDPQSLAQRFESAGFACLHWRPRPWHGLLQAAIRRIDLASFCFQLEHLLSAGIALHDALSEMRHADQNPLLGTLCSKLLEHLHAGRPLSSALELSGNPLGAIALAQIRAGETSGQLVQALQHIHRQLLAEQRLHDQLRSALTYPALLALVLGGVMAFLLIVLVPQLQTFIQNSGSAAPIATRLLFGLSDFIQAHGFLLLLAPPALAAILYWRVKTSDTLRRTVDRHRQSIPLLGSIYLKLTLARFSLTLAELYQAGIPLTQALALSAETLGNNRYLRESCAQVEQSIRDGQSMAAAFRNTGDWPSLLTHMLNCGEKTGNLELCLKHTAQLYEQEATTRIKRLQALIEPSMTLILGLILGWIMLSVMGPIYDIASRMGR